MAAEAKRANNQGIKAVAKEAAQETVHEIFKVFGWDMQRPEEPIKDMFYLRSKRMAEEQASSAARNKLVDMAVGAFVALAIAGAIATVKGIVP